MGHNGNAKFTLIAFGHTLACPQFKSFTELEIFVSSELRARELDERSLEIIESRKFSLTTKKTFVVNEEGLSQAMPGQVVALEHRASEQHLLSLKNMTPVIDRKKIVVFGDSLVELSNYDPLNGLAERLTREYWTQYHVIKRGFSGMNTNVGKEVLPYCLPDEGLEYLIILLGTNDYCLPPDPRHVPKSTYGQNIRDMVLLPVVRAQRPKVVLVSAPPPRQRVQEIPSKGKIRDEATALQYASELRCVSKEMRDQLVYMFDLCTAIMSATAGGDRSKFYAENDDIHFSSEFGNELLAQGVMETLRTAQMSA